MLLLLLLLGRCLALRIFWPYRLVASRAGKHLSRVSHLVMPAFFMISVLVQYQSFLVAVKPLHYYELFFS